MWMIVDAFGESEIDAIKDSKIPTTSRTSHQSNRHTLGGSGVKEPSLFQQEIPTWRRGGVFAVVGESVHDDLNFLWAGLCSAALVLEGLDAGEGGWPTENVAAISTVAAPIRRRPRTRVLADRLIEC